MSNVKFVGGLDPDQMCECGNCDWTGPISAVHDIVDVQERITAGETVPAGECPECGSLAHIVE